MAEPMYRQIAEDLQRQIESGELGHGAQLPTELELRERYSASRNTVRDAIKRLMTRGLIEAHPGRGIYVVEKISPIVTTLTSDPMTGLGGGETDVYLAEVVAGGRTPSSSRVMVEIQRANSAVADALRLDEGATVVSRHHQRFIDRTPWSLQTSFYPMTLVQRGATRLCEAEDVAEGTIVYLKETLGIRQVGYRDSIAVRTPDDKETQFFNLPADGRISVFEIFRVSFDENGDRFRLTVTVYPADRNRFRVNVGDVPTRADSAGPDGQ